MIIKNAKVLLDTFQFAETDVRFDETIREIGTSLTSDNEEIIDGKGMYLIPGLIDIHTHGALGFEANGVDCDFDRWQKYLLSCGITTFFPTTITATGDEIITALKRLEKADGFNIEGPFISKAKKGAHDENKIIDIDVELMDKIKDKVKFTTVAPEINDNLSLIKDLTNLGIRVSIGHTAADYETCKKAFENGATHVTHTFNAMNPLHHREPALVGAAVENDNVFCEVISDGFHLHPSIVRLLYRALGPDRMVLISDAISPLGAPDGEYISGGMKVFVKNGEARLADGTIAGSTTDLMSGMKRAISFGIPMEDAIKMATLTPARASGMDKDRGSITVGKKADLVLLDEKLDITAVIYKGAKV